MRNLKRAAGDKRAKALDSVTSEEDAEADGGWWRVLLLRGLIKGELAVVERLVFEHIEALSAPFTNAMPPWKLQWESIHWWLLQDATPLCVASMYSHPELVRWLLLHGANRATPCYLKQTALDYVGECCEHTAVVATGSCAKASAECVRLLQEPPALPFPPGGDVALSSTFSSELVFVRSPAVTPVSPVRGSSGSAKASPLTGTATAAAAPLQQKIFKCLVHVVWQTPLSNGALIDKYEVRYRIITAEDGDTDGDTDASGSGADESWHLERVAHNRKSREQRILLVGLQFGTLYEVTLRSWSAAGKGDWGRSYKLQTRTSPESLATPPS